MGLPETRQGIIDQIQENVSVIAAGYPVSELGEVFEQTESYFQALGICNLLLKMDVDGFFRNLATSAHTRRYFLLRSKREEIHQHECLAISRNESFFDAIVAGATNLAIEIADQSPADWVSSGEYEDDYCYFHFLHNFVRACSMNATDKSSFGELLDRFEKVANESSLTRFDVCKALSTRDERAFLDAFLALIEQRRQPKIMPLADELVFEAKQHVFVEGLALLQIADTLGFKTERDYTFCPATARRPPQNASYNDVYKDVDELVLKNRRPTGPK